MTQRGATRPSYGPLALTLAGLAVLCIALRSFQILPRLLDLRMECLMSHMYPTYIVHDEQLRAFSRSTSPVMHKYSLREYREQNRNPSLKMADRVMHPAPVLFIPGNAGSYAQVRSMASSAALQFWAEGFEIPDFEFLQAPGPTVWFTIDFNEDFSAFHGRTLEDQAEYVNEAIAYLRAMYPLMDTSDNEVNGTVGIVGHSMGGIVARLATILPNHPPSSVDTIVTLSSPHSFPPVPFDRSMERVYQRLAHTPPAHEPLVISVAGGLLDTQLSSDASSLSLGRIQSPETRLSSFTSAVGSLWSSTDHLAIVWCDQMRYRVARGFLRDYFHYGRDFNLRAPREALLQRRELWRRLLGFPIDANPEDATLAVEAAPMGPTRSLVVIPQLLDTDLTRQRSQVLRQLGVTNVRAKVFKALSPPGPRQTYTGNVSDSDEALAFDLVTNLALGPNADTGHYLDQVSEIFVTVCTRRPKFDSDVKNREPAWCYPVVSHAYERLPWSPPPQESPRRSLQFPEAKWHYDHPSVSLQRLHLSSEFMRTHHVESVRVEYTLNPPKFASHEHVAGVFEMGWTEDKPFQLDGAPTWWHSKAWDLPGVEVRSLLSSFEEHAPLWEWDLPDMDSALLAYTFTLEPAACTRRSHSQPPSTAPMARVISASTNDARTFPSLDVFASNVMPVALHGAAPFMPPPAQAGLRLQLWILDTYRDTVFGNTYNAGCPLPFNKLRARVNWRASIALLVLRYRIALLAWPFGVLALARTKPLGAWDALLQWTRGRHLGTLLAAPMAAHLLLRMGAELGAPTYALGVGITSLRFLWLGPSLALLALVMAISLCYLTELGFRATYLAGKRLLPRLLPEPTPPEPLTTLPGRAAWIGWAAQRRTWLSLLVLAALLVFVPYQIVIVICAVVHLGHTFRSYAGWHEAKLRLNEPTAQSRWEAQYQEHLWLWQFLLWLLPLHVPVIVVWVRNIHARFLMGFTRTDHSVLATAPLLVLVWVYSSSWFVARPKAWACVLGTKIVYGVVACWTLLYGTRYTYTLYECFLVALCWEIGQLVWSLRTPATPASESILMERIALLALPTSLTSHEPTLPMPQPQRAPHLDSLLSTYLATLDQYLEARRQGQDAMARGFNQLTRAKIALGGSFGQRVGQDAYDERMSALVRVQPDGARRASPPPAQTPAEPSTLRRRRQAPAADGGAAGPQGASTAETAPDQEHTTRDVQGYDPLFQFSGLPPPSLKAAQRAFREALATLVVSTDLAPSPQNTLWTIQQRLVSLEHEIEACRAAT